MTHPLVSRLAPIMDGELGRLRTIVAEWVLRTPCAQERATLRQFGAELGAVQRRIRCRSVPPTQEEIEIALTAVLALVNRRMRSNSAEELAPDPSLLTFAHPWSDPDGEQLLS